MKESIYLSVFRYLKGFEDKLDLQSIGKASTFNPVKKNLLYQICSKETDADPFKIINVSPNEIESVSGYLKSGESAYSRENYHIDDFNTFENIPAFGRVVSSDWDRPLIPFSRLKIFNGLYERFIENQDWSETTFFQIHTSRIKKFGESYGCSRASELKQKCQIIDSLYKRIESDGYKSQTELGRGNIHDEIVVNIGRNGKLIFNGGGRHRLIISKLLDIDTIPVIVKVRHNNWQRIRDQIRNNSSTTIREGPHKNHPDLIDII